VYFNCSEFFNFYSFTIFDIYRKKNIGHTLSSLYYGQQPQTIALGEKGSLFSLSLLRVLVEHYHHQQQHQHPKQQRQHNNSNKYSSGGGGASSSICTKMSAPLSDAQQAAVDIVPRITAGLSILGSGFVLGSVLLSSYRNRHVGGGGSPPGTTPLVGRNLLASLSFMDLVSSFMYVIGDVAFPSSSGGMGNQATCDGETFLPGLCVCRLDQPKAEYKILSSITHCWSSSFSSSCCRM
jgi:hypothetical protein